MQQFLFILKSMGLTSISCLLAGFIIGFIQTFFIPEHPHQILPTFLIFGILLFIIGLGVSAIVSVVFAISGNHSISRVFIISVSISLLGLFIYWISIK